MNPPSHPPVTPPERETAVNADEATPEVVPSVPNTTGPHQSPTKIGVEINTTGPHQHE